MSSQNTFLTTHFFTHFLHTLAECKGVSRGFCLIVK
nr:MAG TPA: hypothetical protein [Caudovirales sp. ctMlE25]